MKLFDISGGPIIVIGATGKIGRRLTIYLVENGATVVAVARNNDALLSLREAVSKPDMLSVYALDVSIAEDCKSFSVWFQNRFNKMSIGIVNCSSYRPSLSENADIEKSWIDAIGTNSRNMFNTYEILAKNLDHTRTTSIVFLSSIYGVVAPDFSIYDSVNFTTEPDYPFLKSGIIGLSRYYASKMAASNIRCNTVAAGGVFNDQPKGFLSRYLKKTLQKRMAGPGDLEGVCHFLLAPASQHMTGQVLVVDGGFSVT